MEALYKYPVTNLTEIDFQRQLWLILIDCVNFGALDIWDKKRRFAGKFIGTKEQKRNPFRISRFEFFQINFGWKHNELRKVKLHDEVVFVSKRIKIKRAVQGFWTLAGFGCILAFWIV